MAKAKIKAKAKKAIKASKPVDETVAKKAKATEKIVEKEIAHQKLVQKASATKVKVEKPVKLTKAAAASLEKLTQAGQKWQALYKKTQNIKPQPYNMRGLFEAKTPIIHKVLGWGYILNNKNDRLEVLFQDGVRFLISNYK